MLHNLKFPSTKTGQKYNKCNLQSIFSGKYECKISRPNNFYLNSKLPVNIAHHHKLVFFSPCKTKQQIQIAEVEQLNKKYK